MTTTHKPASPPVFGLTQEEWEALTPNQRGAKTLAWRKEQERKGKRKPKPKSSKPTMRAKDAVIRVGRSTAEAKLGGLEGMRDWDEEELRRGYRRDKNGNFTGRPPEWIPRECYQELTRRALDSASKKLSDHVEEAVSELIAISTSMDADHKDRLKAIEMILTRVMGKEPIKVDIKSEPAKWEVALNVSIVNDEGDDDMEDEGEDD